MQADLKLSLDARLNALVTDAAEADTGDAQLATAV